MGLISRVSSRTYRSFFDDMSGSDWESDSTGEFPPWVQQEIDEHNSDKNKTKREKMEAKVKKLEDEAAIIRAELAGQHPELFLGYQSKPFEHASDEDDEDDQHTVDMELKINHDDDLPVGLKLPAGYRVEHVSKTSSNADVILVCSDSKGKVAIPVNRKFLAKNSSYFQNIFSDDKWRDMEHEKFGDIQTFPVLLSTIHNDPTGLIMVLKWWYSGKINNEIFVSKRELFDSVKLYMVCDELSLAEACDKLKLLIKARFSRELDVMMKRNYEETRDFFKEQQKESGMSLSITKAVSGDIEVISELLILRGVYPGQFEFPKAQRWSDSQTPDLYSVLIKFFLCDELHQHILKQPEKLLFKMTDTDFSNLMMPLDIHYKDRTRDNFADEWYEIVKEYCIENSLYDREQMRRIRLDHDTDAAFSMFWTGPKNYLKILEKYLSSEKVDSRTRMKVFENEVIWHYTSLDVKLDYFKNRKSLKFYRDYDEHFSIEKMEPVFEKIISIILRKVDLKVDDDEFNYEYFESDWNSKLTKKKFERIEKEYANDISVLDQVSKRHGLPKFDNKIKQIKENIEKLKLIVETSEETKARRERIEQIKKQQA